MLKNKQLSVGQFGAVLQGEKIFQTIAQSCAAAGVATVNAVSERPRTLVLHKCRDDLRAEVEIMEVPCLLVRTDDGCEHMYSREQLHAWPPFQDEFVLVLHHGDDMDDEDEDAENPSDEESLVTLQFKEECHGRVTGCAWIVATEHSFMGGGDNDYTDVVINVWTRD